MKPLEVLLTGISVIFIILFAFSSCESDKLKTENESLKSKLLDCGEFAISADNLIYYYQKDTTNYVKSSYSAQEYTDYIAQKSKCGYYSNNE